MSDESKLQHVPSTDVRLSRQSKARSSLATRGLELAGRVSAKRAERDLEAQDEAMYKLGLNYLLGQDGTQDYVAAVACFQKVAHFGHVGAQYELGNCYFLGLGGKRDYRWAKIWFSAAAEGGNADAMYKLGEICKRIAEANFRVYEDSDYKQNGYREAAEWYRKAAAQGHLDAQRRLEELQYQ